MATMTYAGIDVEVDDKGFMIKSDQWTREIAQHIATEAGIPELNADHWKVLEFCRKDAAEKGKVPGLRRISKQTGVATRSLYTLFPKGPGKLAAKCAGLTQPKGCV